MGTLLVYMEKKGEPYMTHVIVKLTMIKLIENGRVKRAEVALIPPTGRAGTNGARVTQKIICMARKNTRVF